MAGTRKSCNPADRMGVYKKLEDVPDQYRLYHHAAAYEGRNVWEEFLEDFYFRRNTSERFKQSARRAGRRWRAHMKRRDRHPALATPMDVEAWSDNLLEQYKLQTAYNQYWVRIERFYEWLQHHTDYPHVYHPVLMAAANCEAARTIWDEKISSGRGDTDE